MMQRIDGTWWEAVLHTLEGTCLLLGYARKVYPSQLIPPRVEPFLTQVKIPLSQIARLTIQFENEESKEESVTASVAFKTDTQISGTESPSSQPKRLEKFDFEGSESVGDLEEDSSSRGWDIYKVNRELFGVKSTYKEELYTTEIDRSAPEYKNNERKASLMATEILKGKKSDNIHVREERGDIVRSTRDEESRFSTVLGSTDPEPKKKSSTLNPNASSFSFNPSASSFAPSSGASFAAPPARPASFAAAIAGSTPPVPARPSPAMYTRGGRGGAGIRAGSRGMGCVRGRGRGGGRGRGQHPPPARK